jgi:hypothetical protein
MGASVKPGPGAAETPAWEDQLLAVDPARYGRFAPQVAKKQAAIRAKRKTASYAGTREALASPPVGPAEIAGRFGAAATARRRARAGVPPTIGRPPGTPGSGGGRAY